jgi:beta-lactam-binding protein with PASTA domain
MCTVPNVTGLNYVVAGTTISSANFVPSGTQTNGGGNQKGIVHTQDPLGGLLLACGSTVTFEYYKP